MRGGERGGVEMLRGETHARKAGETHFLVKNNPFKNLKAP